MMPMILLGLIGVMSSCVEMSQLHDWINQLLWLTNAIGYGDDRFEQEK